MKPLKNQNKPDSLHLAGLCLWPDRVKCGAGREICFIFCTVLPSPLLSHPLLLPTSPCPLLSSPFLSSPLPPPAQPPLLPLRRLNLPDHVQGDCPVSPLAFLFSHLSFSLVFVFRELGSLIAKDMTHVPLAEQRERQQEGVVGRRHAWRPVG